MSLDQPYAVFGGVKTSRTMSSFPLWTKKAAYEGVTMLDTRLSATAPAARTSTHLDIVWPSKLPGFLSLTFFEDDEDRHHWQLALDDPHDMKEKEEKTWISAARLWRAPGQAVTADADVPLIGRAYHTHFLGAHVNLEVRIREGEDEKAPVTQTLYLHNLPLLSGDVDANEGRYWELGVQTFFMPLAKQALFDEFKKQRRKWEHDDETPPLVRLGKLLLEGGRFGPLSYANLQRNVKLWFEERYLDEGGQATTVRLADRWVAGMHWAWVTGKTKHYYTKVFLLKFPPNTDTTAQTAYDCEAEFVGTKDLRGALTPLSRLPLPGQTGKVWIKDIVLQKPKDPEVDPFLTGTYGFESAYWRLPEGFDPSKKPVSLREVEKLGPGKRWTPGDPGRLVFPVTSAAERFQYVCKQLLERITLVNAHKESFHQAYEKNKDELETWNHVVAPMYHAFGKVPFTVNKWFGHVDAGTYEQWSAAGGKFSERAIEDAVREDGRLDLRRTFSKLGALSFHEEQAHQHMEKAWTLFCSDEFQRPFLSGEFIGKDLEIRLGPARDGTLIAVPQITGGERKQLGKALEEFESTYYYGPALIYYIFNNLGLNFPLLSSQPQPTDSSPAAREAANREAREALKRRQEQYAAYLGARYQELLEAEAKGEFAEGLKTSAKWIGAPGKLTIWDSLTGGGLALMLYGNEAQRRLLSEEILELPAGKSFWKLTNEEFDKISDGVRARAGREMVHKDNAGVATFLGLLGQTVTVAELIRKGVKLEAGSVLELIDVVVGTMDSLVKLGQLMAPVYFRVAYKGAVELTEAMLKGAGMVEKFAKGLGKVAAVVAVVKAAYDLFGMIMDRFNGFSLDWGKLIFKILEIAAAVLFFFLPVVGTIIGALLLVAEMVYSWFTETSAEGMMLWWFSTPWGLPLGPVDGADPIPVSQPEKLLELAVEKLNPFLEDVSKKLDGKPELKDVREYFGGYLDAAGQKYGYTVIDKSTTKVVKFALQKA